MTSPEAHDPPPIPVEVTPDAAEYIREQGGVVFLRSSLRHGCCGGRVELVRAEARAPTGGPVPDDRHARHVLPGHEGLALVAERGLLDELEGPIRIDLDRLLHLRSLRVEGAPARPG